MRTSFALAFALIVLPLASAQVPTPPQGCGPIEVQPIVAPQPVGPSEVAQIPVAVKNTGTRAVDVTVSIETSTPGWTVTSSESQDVNVASGATGTVTFTVVPSEDAAQDGTVNVATVGACPAPGGLSCPTPSACSTQGQPQTVVVPFAAPQGFRIPGLEGLDLSPAYVLGGIVLVGLAVAVPLLLRTRRPPRATASCPEPMKSVRAGRGASFPIELRNPADAARKVQLAVGAVPEGWSAFLPLPEIQLAAKETRSLWLMVRAPPEAQTGATADVEVTATDVGRPERPSLVKVRAEVQPDAPEPVLG